MFKWLYCLLLSVALLMPLHECLPLFCTQNAEIRESFHGISDAQKIQSCLVYVIQNNEYQSLDSLQELLNDEEEHLLVELLDKQIKRLQAIEQFVIQTKTSCEPVLKWGQNTTHILIAVKLSHRWDSPPCSKIVKQNYSLVNGRLNFMNVCLVSNAEIKFLFQGGLYGKVGKNFVVKKDGVGTYLLEVEKAFEGEAETYQIWPYLFEGGDKVQIWQQIMGRNSTLKKEFDGMRERLEKRDQKPTKSQL